MPESLFNKVVDLLAWNFKSKTTSRIFLIFFIEFCKIFKNTSRRLPLIFKKLDFQTFNSKQRVQVFLNPGFSGSRFFRVWVQSPAPGFRSSQENLKRLNMENNFLMTFNRTLYINFKVCWPVPTWLN